jgi:type VI secretion system protein ImpM
MQLTYGFFGKLPSLGDFVSRGWSNSGRDGLDRLLQEALGELLVSSPSAAKEAVANAPSLVLTIRPGVASEQGYVVAVLPSEDRVGRRFPLSAGVQWLEDQSSGKTMGWPSLEYARALVACVQQCIETDADPDHLSAEISRLGSPQAFRQTFDGLGEDETVPRLASDVMLLRLQGPLTALSSSLAALCTALNDSSDVLGFSLDPTGEVQDFFVCRRLASGARLAAVFDGRWVERGWLSYGSVAPPDDTIRLAVPTFDDDATRPR